jgi:hypothetical protein
LGIFCGAPFGKLILNFLLFSFSGCLILIDLLDGYTCVCVFAFVHSEYESFVEHLEYLLLLCKLPFHNLNSEKSSQSFDEQI